MEATLLLVILETGRVHTAVYYPTMFECLAAMHTGVVDSGVSVGYNERTQSYSDGEYVLYCE